VRSVPDPSRGKHSAGTIANPAVDMCGLEDAESKHANTSFTIKITFLKDCEIGTNRRLSRLLDAKLRPHVSIFEVLCKYKADFANDSAGACTEWKIKHYHLVASCSSDNPEFATLKVHCLPNGQK
jgi:hypothetical protein